MITINEPNILAITHGGQRQVALGNEYPRNALPDQEIGDVLVAAHRAAAPIIRRLTNAKAGWTIGNQALTSTPGNEEKYVEVHYLIENKYLEVSRDDDFVGTQSYTSQPVDANGILPHPAADENTLMGWAYRPDALGIAVRHTRDVVGPDVAILITENGIATDDDEKRIVYTSEALSDLSAAIADGIDVRGYLHWNALDNFEWGHWGPTFGLVAVDRETFERQPKPSLDWLGEVARSNSI